MYKLTFSGVLLIIKLQFFKIHLKETYLHLLTSMDNIDPEGIHRIPPDVVPVHPGDQHLPLVVVAEQAADHVGTARHHGREKSGDHPPLGR